jgi:peptide/nickel transport system permease protein
VILSIAWLVVLFVATTFAHFLAPYDPYKQSLRDAFALPNAAHLLGTDGLGRDLLSRLMYGGSGILSGSLETVLVALLIGVPLGLAAGYYGGWIDQAVSFYINVLLALPGFVIIVCIAFVSSNSVPVIMAALGVVFSGALARIVRGSTQAARNLLYVDSARVSGMNTPRIMFRHIFPNVTGPLVVQSFLFLSQAFMILTSLSFLGLGFDPQSPDWGQAVLQATQELNRHPWLMFPIGFALIFTVLAFNQLGTGLRSALPQAQRESMLVDRKRRVASAPTNVVRGAASAPPGPESALNPDIVLAARRITVSFPGANGETAVVDRVSLEVRRGEVLGLVGESGCGKSMTSLAIMGLVPSPGAMTADSLQIRGIEVAQMPEREFAKLRGTTIAMIGQEPMVALDPCFTAGAALMEALQANKGLSRKAAKAEALDLLAKVGIARKEQAFASYPHELSGGMAQRVAIALALTGDPEILVADEPTTALDVTIQAEIIDLLLDIRESDGMTILLVTHDLGVVSDVCDRVAVMYAGQLIETGSAAAVFSHPTHPYTRGLLGAVPDLELTHAKLPEIAGRVPLPKDWPSGCRFYQRCPIRIHACQEAPVELLEVEPGQASRCLLAISGTAKDGAI